MLDKGVKGLHIIIYTVLQYLVVFKSAVTDRRGEREKNDSVIKKRNTQGESCCLSYFNCVWLKPYIGLITVS